MFNSAEHETFPSNKYENANNSWQFHILLAEKFSCSAVFSMKEFAVVTNEIDKHEQFHAQLSWAWKMFYNRGAWFVLQGLKS